MITATASRKAAEDARTFEIVDLSDVPFAAPVEGETILILPNPDGYTVIRHAETLPSIVNGGQYA